MVSGNRVLGRMYGVWEQGVGENVWCLGTGCWGECMVSGNRVLKRMYGVWEQGVRGPKEVGSNRRMAKIP